MQTTSERLARFTPPESLRVENSALAQGAGERICGQDLPGAGQSGALNNRILIVDDNPAIHSDFQKVLNKSADQTLGLIEAEATLFGDGKTVEVTSSFELQSAFQGQEALERVCQGLAQKKPFAMAFVDVRMPPGWDGVETVTHLWRVDPDLQIVICTVYSDYSWDQMITKLGSPDNLVILKKPFDSVEVLQLAHALTRKWELNRQAQFKLEELSRMVTVRTQELQDANKELQRQVQERVQAEISLRSSEERFAKAFEASPMSLTIQTIRNGRYVAVNECFLALTGHSREQVIGHTAQEIGLWVEPEADNRIAQSDPLRSLECQFRTRHGGLRQVQISTEFLQLGTEPHLLMLAHDITERVQLERQFRQAQKMEAIGQLAAGVAHDFNNILTVIQGYAGILQLSLGEEGRHAKALNSILSASERATSLVRQLLMFSRKRIMQFQTVELNEVVSDLSTMLRQLVGEHILIETHCALDLPPVHADRGMLEQVLVNLTINGRDAIAKDGRIRIISKEVKVDDQMRALNPDARPGQFVCLTVSDTGSGIPADLLPHLFEPFFTTKEVGKGTGLGLATVYGIVKQHQGWIEVESAPGAGSSFRIYFPAAARKTPAILPERVMRGPSAVGSETILVAEDEPALREMVSDTLSMCGYRVLVAATGPAALEIWQAEQGRIDLLLTDIVMPGGLLGTDLAKELKRISPKLRVILTTGYSPKASQHQNQLAAGVSFLPKPYSPQVLAEVVRASLDGAVPSGQ